MYKQIKIIIISCLISFFTGGLICSIGLYIYVTRSSQGIDDRVSKVENSNTELRDINRELDAENKRLAGELDRARRITREAQDNLKQARAVVNQIREHNRTATSSISRIESILNYYRETE